MTRMNKMLFLTNTILQFQISVIKAHKTILLKIQILQLVMKVKTCLISLKTLILKLIRHHYNLAIDSNLKLKIMNRPNLLKAEINSSKLKNETFLLLILQIKTKLHKKHLYK
jgi:hypothetical protein